MEKKVEDSENLFRAIRPDDMFWKNEEKTKLSSAACFSNVFAHSNTILI